MRTMTMMMRTMMMETLEEIGIGGVVNLVGVLFMFCILFVYRTIR